MRTRTRVPLTVTLIALSTLAATIPAAAEHRPATPVTVLGDAEIETHDPDSVFEFSVHVDCVRARGAVGVVTAIVSDAEDFSGADPGDPISLTVRDGGARDRVGFASRHQVRRCHGPRPTQEITSGDFRLLR